MDAQENNQSLRWCEESPMGYAMYFYRFSDGRSIGGDKQRLWPTAGRKCKPH